MGNWIWISNPDDFFQHHIDIDFNKLNYAPLEFNVKYEDVESEHLIASKPLYSVLNCDCFFHFKWLLRSNNLIVTVVLNSASTTV